MDELKKYVQFAVKKKASDIHLIANAFPYIRVNGKLIAINKTLLSPQGVQKKAMGLLKQNQLKKLEVDGDVDVGVVVDGVGLRINIHKNSSGFGMAIRVIPTKIPTPEELNFHETMAQIPEYENGLVIVSGATGTGKSTTLASIIEQMNQTSKRHIITLEDPIEYRFKDKESLIEQRQLGLDFSSFPQGLRHVLRQDPDVIMIGEMRDQESIALALTAAETGHLVLSTLHAPNAPEVVERIVNVFEGIAQQQILIQLSATLRMVVAQKLLPKKDGGLIAAREVLVTTSAIQNAIRQNNLATLRSAVQTGKKHGMISMDRAVEELEAKKLI